MKVILLLLVLVIQTAFGGTPSEALGEFKKSAQAQNFEDTWNKSAKFEDLPEQVTGYLKGKIKRIIAFAAKGWDFEIVEEKVESYKKLEAWFKVRKTELKKKNHASKNYPLTL